MIKMRKVLLMGIVILSALISGVYSFAAEAQTPWKDNANGILYKNAYWVSYTMGYRFTPNKNGKITKLGGYFNGTKTVYLWDTKKTLIASAKVTSKNDWSYTDINPVQVTAGQLYTVGVYLPGPSRTGSYRYKIANLPRTYGDITIKNSGFCYGKASCPNTAYTYVMYGQVDVGFVPETISADTSSPALPVFVENCKLPEKQGVFDTYNTTIRVEAKDIESGISEIKTLFYGYSHGGTEFNKSIYKSGAVIYDAAKKCYYVEYTFTGLYGASTYHLNAFAVNGAGLESEIASYELHKW